MSPTGSSTGSRACRRRWPDASGVGVDLVRALGVRGGRLAVLVRKQGLLVCLALQPFGLRLRPLGLEPRLLGGRLALLRLLAVGARQRAPGLEVTRPPAAPDHQQRQHDQDDDHDDDNCGGVHAGDVPLRAVAETPAEPRGYGYHVGGSGGSPRAVSGARSQHWASTHRLHPQGAFATMSMYADSSAPLDVTPLKDAVAGDVVTPADAGWDDARRAWNLAADQRPAL